MILRGTRARLLGAAVAGAAATAVLAGASSATAANVTIVGYAVPEPAFARLIPAFQKTPGGKGVTFSSSYGASGDQSRAVANGLPADLVNLSVEPDIQRLVDAGLVSPRWANNRYRGIPASSIVVFGVRKGNPQKVRTWDDLLKPGTQIVTANFQTSGAARWNALAAYGAALKRGRTADQAKEYLTAMFRNVVAQEKSGRDATNAFASGRGNVLLTYENEAIAAQREGVPLDYVIPPQTMKIEAPAAVIQTSSNRAAAQRFLTFLWTPQGQTIWGQAGFRPVDRKVAARFAKRYPRPRVLFDINLFGGWRLAERTFFAPGSGVAVVAARGGR